MEKVEVVTDFLFLGSKTTADGDCSHETRRQLLLGRDGETVETVSDFIFLGSKITVMVTAAMKLKDAYSLEGIREGAQGASRVAPGKSGPHEMARGFSSPVATAEFSKFAGILNAALSQHRLSGSEIAQLEFHHLH